MRIKIFIGLLFVPLIYILFSGEPNSVFALNYTPTCTGTWGCKNSVGVITSNGWLCSSFNGYQKNGCTDGGVGHGNECGASLTLVDGCVWHSNLTCQRSGYGQITYGGACYSLGSKYMEGNLNAWCENEPADASCCTAEGCSGGGGIACTAADYTILSGSCGNLPCTSTQKKYLKNAGATCTGELSMCKADASCSGQGGGTDHAAIGWHDPANSDACVLSGWACDPDYYSASLGIHFYQGNTFIGNTVASSPSDPGVIASCGGVSAPHRFSYPLPAALQDNLPHNITAYAIGLTGSNTLSGANPALLGNPQTISCASPCGLLTDPQCRFETGSGFIPWTSGGSASWGSQVVASPVAQGSKALKVVFSGASDTAMVDFYAKVLSAPPAGKEAFLSGAVYVASSTLAGPGTLNVCLTHWKDHSSGRWIGNDCVPIDLASTGGWQRFTLRSPQKAADENNILVEFNPSGTSGTVTFYVDDFYLDFRNPPTCGLLYDPQCTFETGNGMSVWTNSTTGAAPWTVSTNAVGVSGKALSATYNGSLTGGVATQADLFSIIRSAPPAGQQAVLTGKVKVVSGNGFGSPGTIQACVTHWKNHPYPAPFGGWIGNDCQTINLATLGTWQDINISSPRKTPEENTVLVEFIPSGTGGNISFMVDNLSLTYSLIPSPTEIPPTIDACPGGNVGNINCSSDGFINQADVDILLLNWAPAGPVPVPATGNRSSDLTGDGKVDESDMYLLLVNWKVS